MKLKDAQKKFNFLKKLELSDKDFLTVANLLERTLKGDSNVHRTPLADACIPSHFLAEWDEIFENNMHKMNPILLDLERSNRDKFGPRSIAVPWIARKDDLQASWLSQDDNHIPKFYQMRGDANLSALPLNEAAQRMKTQTSAGIPFLCKKGKVLDELLNNFDKYFDREDPCALYTRTQESNKTRNVWGYPFADSLFEMMFYAPLLVLQKTKHYRAALISPDAVAERITEMIIAAKDSDRWLYSVDFKAFDASVRYQYIILAFDYIKSCFFPIFSELITVVCERFYTIGLVTPIAIFKGKHGVPSGSTFTNEIDSIVQICIALTNDFIKESECQVQGDDGVYLMLRENVSAFKASFEYAGLKMNDKARLAKDYVLYCQNLYHIDYLKDGYIGGIYPVYRAINHLLFQERFVNFSKAGIKGKDYFGIRALSILENCKYHPLFEELVRFVVAREKYSLDVSDDGLRKYCSTLTEDLAIGNLNHQHGTNVYGIRKFAAFKMVAKILAEEDLEIEENV